MKEETCPTCGADELNKAIDEARKLCYGVFGYVDSCALEIQNMYEHAIDLALKEIEKKDKIIQGIINMQEAINLSYLSTHNESISSEESVNEISDLLLPFVNLKEAKNDL